MTAGELRAHAGFRLGRGRWLVPPWIAPALLFCALVLIPWIAFLFLTLPRHYVANHWQLAWGGFDIALRIALATTAVLVVRRSPFTEVTATITATLLLCDAWFDVLTSRGTSDIAQALAAALLVELPLAALFLDRTQPRSRRRNRKAIPPISRIHDHRLPPRRP